MEIDNDKFILLPTKEMANPAIHPIVDPFSSLSRNLIHIILFYTGMA